MGSKKRIILFGASQYGKSVVDELKKDFDIVGFVDNDSNKHGIKIKGFTVYSPDDLSNLEYDKIYITSMYAQDITGQLIGELGINIDAIEYIQMRKKSFIQKYKFIFIFSVICVIGYLVYQN